MTTSTNRAQAFAGLAEAAAKWLPEPAAKSWTPRASDTSRATVPARLG